MLLHKKLSPWPQWDQSKIPSKPVNMNQLSCAAVNASISVIPKLLLLQPMLEDAKETWWLCAVLIDWREWSTIVVTAVQCSPLPRFQRPHLAKCCAESQCGQEQFHLLRNSSSPSKVWVDKSRLLEKIISNELCQILDLEVEKITCQ